MHTSEPTGPQSSTPSERVLGPRPDPRDDPMLRAVKRANVGARLEIESARRRAPTSMRLDDRLARIEQHLAELERGQADHEDRICQIDAHTASLQDRLESVEATSDYAASLGESAARGRGGWAA